MDHPKDVGDRTTLAVMLALRGLGYHVSVPFGGNTRYLRTAAVYVTPIEDVPREAATLRIDPPRNGQSKLIRLAADYAIAKVDVELAPRSRHVAEAARP